MVKNPARHSVLSLGGQNNEIVRSMKKRILQNDRLVLKLVSIMSIAGAERTLGDQ